MKIMAMYAYENTKYVYGHALLSKRLFSFFQVTLASVVLLASKATPLLILLRMLWNILDLVAISSFSIGGCQTDRWGYNFYTQCPESRKFKVCSTCAGKDTIDKVTVEKILKGSLDLIPSPSPSVKIQIMGGKVCLRCKGKTLLGVVNKLLKTKSLLTSPSNVLPYYLK